MTEETVLRSFDDLLEATDSSDASELEAAVAGRMRGDGSVVIDVDDGGFSLKAVRGSRTVTAEFTFPLTATEFWEVLNDYTDETDSLD
jgi:hypothetical protein